MHVSRVLYGSNAVINANANLEIVTVTIVYGRNRFEKKLM